MTWDNYLFTNRFLSHKPIKSHNHQLPGSPTGHRHSREGAEGQVREGGEGAALLNASSPSSPASPSNTACTLGGGNYIDNTFYSHYSKCKKPRGRWLWETEHKGHFSHKEVFVVLSLAFSFL